MNKLLIIAGLCVMITGLASSKKLFCHYDRASGSGSGSGNGNIQGSPVFDIGDIDRDLCTHLVFDRATIQDLDLVPVDVDDTTLYTSFNDLKREDSDLKTILSVGGPGVDVSLFENMAAKPEDIDTFIESTIDLLNLYDFDGINLVWPAPCSHKHIYTQLVEGFQTGFKYESKVNNREFELVATVTYENDDCYHRDEILEAVDYLLVKSHHLYDMADTGKTTHHSPLYHGSQASVENALAKWYGDGTLASKIIMTLSTTGQGYKLTNQGAYNLDQDITTAYTSAYSGYSSGWAPYYEICQLTGNTYRDDAQKISYDVTNSGYWFAYDDLITVGHKVQFVKDQGYGGVSVWDLASDDFAGSYCTDGKYPFIRHVWEELIAVPEPTNFCIDKTGHLYPHPDPTKFYACDDQRTFVMNCPANLVFDSVLLVCNYPI